MKSVCKLLLSFGLAAVLLCVANRTAHAGNFPRMLAYQAILTDNQDQPLTQNGLSVRYLLYADSTGGSFLWAEVTQIDIVDGKLSHLLGSITPLPDSLFVKRDTLWLELLVDAVALEPRTRILPSPYSIRVATVDQSTGGQITGDVDLLNSTGNRVIEMDTEGQGNAAELNLWRPSVGAVPSISMMAQETTLEGGRIRLYKENDDLSVEIDAEEGTGDVGQVNLYMKRTGGGSTPTVNLWSSPDGIRGGYLKMYPLNGGSTVELYAEYEEGGTARMGLNGAPDSSGMQVESDQPFAGSFTNNWGNVEAVGVTGRAEASPGLGIGGLFSGGNRGVKASATNDQAGGEMFGVDAYAAALDIAAGRTYGVWARADRGIEAIGVRGIANDAPVCYGVMGTAAGPGVNWGGWFGGNGHFSGALGIGTENIPAGYSLAVDGKVICEEVEVVLSENWPDYVFDDGYKLMSLDAVEAAIDEDGHLPGVPSAKSVAENGIKLGDMNATLLEKIEELTLHMIAMNKNVRSLEKENAALTKRIAELEEKGAGNE